MSEIEFALAAPLLILSLLGLFELGQAKHISKTELLAAVAAANITSGQQTSTSPPSTTQTADTISSVKAAINEPVVKVTLSHVKFSSTLRLNVYDWSRGDLVHPVGSTVNLPQGTTAPCIVAEITVAHSPIVTTRFFQKLNLKKTAYAASQ